MHLQHSFVMCFLHVKDRKKVKLRDLGVNTECAKFFVNDIFGQQQGTHLFCGLVDCDSEAEFDEKLCQFKDVWNEMEMDARKTSLPEFHAWFTRYHATNMKHKMLKGLGEKGLGSPPVQFTNNPNESVNARIKKKVDYKKACRAECVLPKDERIV